MRILIVEDDKDLAETIKRTLQRYYTVDLAFTGERGEYFAHINDYDLIILDIVLPDMDGREVCQMIRRSGIKIPVLFLSGKDDISDKVQALDIGGDDYLTKPFSSFELLARIRTLLRRTSAAYTEDILIIDDLVVDVVNRSVSRENKNIDLRRKEFDLLEYMMRNKRRVLTRGMILEHVWENGTDEFTNTVDVHIKYLRDKVDRPFQKKLIKTVHGIGYKIEDDLYEE